MKVPAQGTRQLVCVATILMITALAVVSIRPLVSSASGSATPEAATHAALAFDASSGPSGRTITLGLDDGEVVLADQGGAVLSSRPLMQTSEVVVKGSTGDDTLVVDFTHGNPIPAGGLKFEGGAQVTRSGDAIVIEGGQFQTAIYDYYNANDGRIVLDGSVINYAGLEPISVTGGAANAVINLPADAKDNLAILEDDGVAGNGMSRLRSGNGTFETTDFNNPTTSLTINASNDGEKITVNNVDGGFVAKINLKGGTGNDTFALGDGATLKGGDITGVQDTLDYSAYTTAVSVNLGLSSTSPFNSDMNGVQETPPNAGDAFGSSNLQYDHLNHRVSFITIGASGITPAQVTGLNLRRGPVNAAGPVVVNLLGLGSLASDGSNGFIYNANNIPLPPAHEAALFGGLLYLEVETAAFPAGEVRGQIINTNFGFIGPAVATATGVGQVSGISTVIGGSGDDSLVGSTLHDTLRGGPGDDTLYAGPGPSSDDKMQGEGGNDTLCWNFGDAAGGFPVDIDGGTGTDLVNLNDSYTIGGAAILEFSPFAGGRLLFSHSFGFKIVIGTVETVTVSGFNGNDTFLVGSLAGVNDLTTMNFNGMIGNDIFNLKPSATITFNVNGGEPLPPIFPGDSLALDTTGVTNLALSSNNTATGSQGAYTFGNRQPVNFQTVDAVNPTRIKVTDVTVAEGNAGSTGAVFTVSLEAPTNTNVSVDYVTFNGTATAPGDYTSVNGTLNFAAGQTTRVVTVPVNGDMLREGDENFVLNLSNLVGALVADSQGVATITDDDPLPSLSIANTSVTEGNGGTTAANFTVSLSSASGQAVSVNYATANGSATAPGDFAAGSGTLNFAAGETSKSVTVLVMGDTLNETNENFVVNLSSPVNATIATAQATGTVNDDDALPSLSITNTSVTEGNSGTTPANFTVSLSSASGQAVSVTYATANGTATAPDDYTTANGTLNFAAGETSKSVSVLVVGDTTNETNENFFVNLSGPVNTTIASAQGTGTINDDEALPSLSIANASVTEGNSGTTAANFTVSLSSASGQAVSVNYATANGSATAPGDFAAGSGTLNFAAGETSKSVTVLVMGDTLNETNENFVVNLSGPVNATIATAQATGTILNDDPSPDLSVGDVTITEGNAGTTNLVFTATLSAASSQSVTLDYFTSDGTALTPGDYQFAGGTMVFNPGQTSRTITVPIIGDTTAESSESFFVNLTNPTNANVLTVQAKATIFDDDASGLFQFSASTGSAAESSGSVRVTVTRTGDASGVATVYFETSDLTATQRSDYTFGSSVVQFAPSETSKTVNVLLVNDALTEGAESFAVTLSSPSGNFVVGSPGQIVVTLTDDDVSSASNPIDDATFFVRQHYMDFLGREPDPPGLNFWVGEITSCGADAGCRAAKRVQVSASFFLSIEFQETGGFATRMQRVAFERLSTNPMSRVPYLQFMRDTRQVGAGVIVGSSGYETKLEANKQTYTQQIVTSADFLARFPITSAAAYVDALFASAGVTPTGAERTAAINAFGSGGTAGRVAALRSVTDSTSVRQAEFNSSFVLAEFFGYLRRNPTDAPDFDDAGYQFWLSKLNSFSGDFIKAEMVKAFIASTEYRGRFGQP